MTSNLLPAAKLDCNTGLLCQPGVPRPGAGHQGAGEEGPRGTSRMSVLVRLSWGSLYSVYFRSTRSMSVLAYWKRRLALLKMMRAISQSQSTLSSYAFFISPNFRFVNVTWSRDPQAGREETWIGGGKEEREGPTVPRSCLKILSGFVHTVRSDYTAPLLSTSQLGKLLLVLQNLA